MRHPDIQLVFTDDGLELAAAVRDRCPPVRIIVTSGARMVEITDLPDGSVFLSKPYNYTMVMSAMREMLA